MNPLSVFLCGLLSLALLGVFPQVASAQLPTYLKAEKVKHGVLLIIKVADNDQRLDKIAQAHAKFVKAEKSVPDLVIVDATKRPSASKLKGVLF